MKFYPAVVLLAFVVSSTALASPETPGADQKKPIALIGGTLHPVSSAPIEGGVLLFDKGKITAIGAAADIPADAERISIVGKHVYPGMFDAFTNMGLVEVNALRPSRDESESGRFNPNVRAEVAVNPDSELIPVARANGVLLVATAPSGGLISGKAAVIQLDGWTWEDMTLRSQVGLIVNWPRMAAVLDVEGKKSAGKQSGASQQSLKYLREQFTNARAYLKSRENAPDLHPLDLKWEAMASVLDSQTPMIVVADRVRQIQSAVAFAEEEKVKLVIYGGYDAPLCAKLLNAHKIPVIVGGVQRLPRSRSDDYDAPFTLAKRLFDAKIEFCISGAGRFGASQVRNLPYHAAMAAAFGLPRSEALKAITLSPARILGVADRVGSLEVGKDATMIITDGDPLETVTHVDRAYIQGRVVDLSSRHTRLWRKYQEKYRRQDEKK